MDEEKSLTKSNHPKQNKGKKWWWCGSTKHLQVTSRYFPVGIAFRKAKMLALEMELSQYEAKKSG